MRRKQHGISKPAQYFSQVSPQIGVVLDDQYGFAAVAVDNDIGLFRFVLLGAAEVSRQVNFYGRAMIDFAVNFYVTAGLLDEAVDLTQSEAGALAWFFCGEERLEGSACHVRWHSGAGIGYTHEYVLSRRQLRVGSAIFFVGKDVARLDRDLSAARHRVACIESEIDQRGFQLVRI